MLSQVRQGADETGQLPPFQVPAGLIELWTSSCYPDASLSGWFWDVTAATTDNTRRLVWIGLLNVNRQVRYYGELSDRYSKKSKRLLILLAVAGSVEATLVLTVGDPLSGAWKLLIFIFAAAIAALSIWAAIEDYAKKAAVLRGINLECSYLETEWEDLWNRIHRIDDDSTLRENRRLNERLIAITSRSSPAGVHEDQKLNEKSWVDACNVMVQNHA